MERPQDLKDESCVTRSFFLPAAYCLQLSPSHSERRLPRISDPHLDVAKARRRGAVPGAHGLHGLAFAAIGRAPQRPLLGAADGVAGIPELGGDAAVTGVLEQARLLAALDLPADFGAELENVAAVVDRPAPVGPQTDAVARVGVRVGELRLA